MMEPNLAGFREAQERKRALMGEDVVFYGRPVLVWEPGIPMDPETGRPYDPTVVPLSSGAASAVIRCGVAFRSAAFAGRSGVTEVAALGRIDATNVILIANSGAASAANGKESFDVRGDHFQIESLKFDGVSGLDRLLIYGTRGG